MTDDIKYQWRIDRTLNGRYVLSVAMDKEVATNFIVDLFNGIKNPQLGAVSFTIELPGYSPEIPKDIVDDKKN